MNLMLITREVAIYAPGHVFKTIIDELSKRYSVYLVSRKCNPNWNNKEVTHIKSSSYIPSARFSQLSQKLCGINLFEYLWILRQLNLVTHKQMQDIDIVISFLCATSYMELVLGYLISKKFSKKWIVYSVDALPSPPEWDKLAFRNKRVTFINKYLVRADGIYFPNEQMLDYQLRAIPNYRGKSGVILVPSRFILVNKLEKERSDIFTFLYTGVVYGPRKVNSLLEAFRMFLGINSASKLIFVGTKLNSSFNDYMDLIEQGYIEIIDYTDDLNSFYQKATVLIDLNSVYNDDIFLSSKVVNYLPLNKPIISVSGDNSPSRNILKNDSSIFHCKHDPYEICSVMKMIVSINEFPFEQRNNLIKKFEVNSVLTDFENDLKNL